MGLKAFKYRLYPSQSQERQMFQVLNVCRHFYNMYLEDRKLAYDLEGRSVTKSEQERLAKRYRMTFPQAQIVFSQTLQTVADDLDKAFRAFFRRVKACEKPGYPRFKGRHRFHSFAFKQFGVGAKLDGRRLKLFGIGRVVVFVDPASTSKCCSNCGRLFQDFDLSTRWVECACGLSLDRDHNAAMNILNRNGWDTSVPLNAAPLPQPNGKGKRKRAVEAAQLQP